MSPADRDVLTSLPSTRPTRRSPKRASAAAAEPTVNGARPDAEKAPAKRVAASKAKPKAAAAKKPAARKATTAKAPAKAAAATKAKAKATAKPGPKATATEPKAAPRNAASSSPPTPPAGWATPDQKPGQSGGGGLIGTAVEAVGELAQIGLAFGGQALKQALQRLPKP
jgi:hypothetical protein